MRLLVSFTFCLVLCAGWVANSVVRVGSLTLNLFCVLMFALRCLNSGWSFMVVICCWLWIFVLVLIVYLVCGCRFGASLVL